MNDILNFAKLEAGEAHYVMSECGSTLYLSALEELIAPQLRTR